MEKQGDRNIRRVVGFNDDRCFISFFGIENFIAKIDTYENHQMKRARQTDRSLESLGNVQKLSKNPTCRISILWQYGLWSFQTGYIKLERFLPKNQHTQRKLLNFEFWINGELSKSAKI